MKKFLEDVITGKGADLDSPLLEEKGYLNFTYRVLIESICSMPSKRQKLIEEKIRFLLFRKEDVFSFLERTASLLVSG